MTGFVILGHMPPTHTKRTKKLLKRSAKFRDRIAEAFRARHHRPGANLVRLNELLEQVDHEIVRLGRKRVAEPRTKK